jgi:hypothetical protein
LGHKVLELYHISSLPVRNVSTGKCAGFIDSLDILGYRTTHHTTPRHVPGANNNMNLGRYLISVCTPSVEAGATLTDLDKAFEKFSTKGISELCGTSSARRLTGFEWNGSHCWAVAADFSKRNPFVPIPINQNLYYMLENIKRYATLAVHRVPIVSLDEQVGVAFSPLHSLLFSLTTIFVLQDPKIMALVSQSDIAAYLAKHISVLGPRYAHDDVRVLPSWADNSPR